MGEFKDYLEVTKPENKTKCLEKKITIDSPKGL